MYHQVSVATLLPWMELLLKKSLLKRCTCSGNEINFTILVSWTSNFLPGQNEEKATVNPRNEEGEIDHMSSKVISEIYCSKMIYRQFWAVLEKLFFHPRKCQNTYVSCHTLYGWHNVRCAADKMHCAADMMRGAANTMLWCGQRNECEVWWVG